MFAAMSVHTKDSFVNLFDTVTIGICGHAVKDLEQQKCECEESENKSCTSALQPYVDKGWFRLGNPPP